MVMIIKDDGGVRMMGNVVRRLRSAGNCDTNQMELDKYCECSDLTSDL